MSDQKRQKHVIFLGAGASASSGYPLANDLRIRMCDRESFEHHVKERLDIEDMAPGDFYPLREQARRLFNDYGKASALLKAGAFGTMDELSQLASGGSHHGEILQLKKLLRLVFALENPQMFGYGKSDYPVFVNALFQQKACLRDDVSVLSFNYGPFLEYTLFNAVKTRCAIGTVPKEIRELAFQASTSGFHNLDDLTWIEQGGFCHLKLHGTTVPPDLNDRALRMSVPSQPGDEGRLHSKYFFNFAIDARLAALRDGTLAAQAPPVLLPWEIVHGDGRLLTNDEFLTQVGSEWEHAGRFQLFCAIWERARREVQAADIVSFVGLSMNAFLEPAWRYLFNGKEGSLTAIVANEAHQFDELGIDDSQPTFNTRLPVGKVRAMLKKMMPILLSSDGGIKLPDIPSLTVRARRTFRGFIHWELA